MNNLKSLVFGMEDVIPLDVSNTAIFVTPGLMPEWDENISVFAMWIADAVSIFPAVFSNGKLKKREKRKYKISWLRN